MSHAAASITAVAKLCNTLIKHLRASARRKESTTTFPPIFKHRLESRLLVFFCRPLAHTHTRTCVWARGMTIYGATWESHHHMCIVVCLFSCLLGVPWDVHRERANNKTYTSGRRWRFYVWRRLNLFTLSPRPDVVRISCMYMTRFADLR